MHFNVLAVIKASSSLKLESILCLTVSCVTDNFVKNRTEASKSKNNLNL